MEERRDELARLVTLANGKPLEEARKEIQFSLGYFGWFAEEARRMTGEWIPFPHTRDMARVVRVAERLEYGLVAANDAARDPHRGVQGVGHRPRGRARGNRGVH